MTQVGLSSKEEYSVVRQKRKIKGWRKNKVAGENVEKETPNIIIT